MARFEVRAAKPNEIRDLGMERLLDQPGFAPHMCRVGMLEGHVIAYALTIRRTLNYGIQRLRVIGIGDVFVEPAHRGNGYANRLLQNTLTYAVEQGAHLALLRDTIGYFDRFGFCPVWPDYYMTFSAEQAQSLPVKIRLKAPERAHIPAIADLYDRHWSHRVTYKRTPEQWVWRALNDLNRHTIVAVDRDGQVCGYISGHDLLSAELEVIADTLDTAAAFIAEAGRLHAANGVPQVRWLVPPDDALVTFARDLLDIEQSAQYHTRSGWMARVIDMPALIGALLPEMTAQASTTMSDFDAKALHMVPHSDRVEIRMKRYSASIGQQDFVQLVFGSLTPVALARRTNLNVESVHLLGALFPPRVAVLGHWDWF